MLNKKNNSVCLCEKPMGTPSFTSSIYSYTLLPSLKIYQ
uniref:Uncharacterized protein n=1 Tax=Rhizophora mucronata TaxID=61149 RepID=A0A2P2QHN6_RHIMU